MKNLFVLFSFICFGVEFVRGSLESPFSHKEMAMVLLMITILLGVILPYDTREKD